MFLLHYLLTVSFNVLWERQMFDFTISLFFMMYLLYSFKDQGLVL